MGKGNQDYFENEKQERAYVKHGIYITYLQAYFPIMTSKKCHFKNIQIIDGFAGPGKHTTGEDGSPVLICKALINHSHVEKNPELLQKIILTFIEKNATYAETLEENLKDYKQKLDIRILNEEFADAITSVLHDADANFVFIDPFGFSDIPMSILQTIFSHPNSEILLTFMDSSIRRFRKAKKNKKTIDELVGCQGWLEETKNLSKQKFLQKFYDLFTAELGKFSNKLYTLKFAIKNKNNSHVYHLIFATTHLRGIEKMKYAMHKVSQCIGEFVFSEFGSGNRIEISDDKTATAKKVATIIRKQFAGQINVTGEEIKSFILLKTNYHFNFKTQLRVQLEANIELRNSSFIDCIFQFRCLQMKITDLFPVRKRSAPSEATQANKHLKTIN